MGIAEHPADQRRPVFGGVSAGARRLQPAILGAKLGNRPSQPRVLARGVLKRQPELADTFDHDGAVVLAL